MESSLAYLNWVRRRECIVSHSHGHGEPHHLDKVGSGSNRHKPMIEHYSAIPVCRDCHNALESGKAKEFCRKNRFDPWEWNAKLLAKWLWETRQPIPVYNEPVKFSFANNMKGLK